MPPVTRTTGRWRTTDMRPNVNAEKAPPHLFVMFENSRSNEMPQYHFSDTMRIQATVLAGDGKASLAVGARPPRIRGLEVLLECVEQVRFERGYVLTDEYSEERVIYSERRALWQAVDQENGDMVDPGSHVFIWEPTLPDAEQGYPESTDYHDDSSALSKSLRGSLIPDRTSNERFSVVWRVTGTLHVRVSAKDGSGRMEPKTLTEERAIDITPPPLGERRQAPVHILARSVKETAAKTTIVHEDQLRMVCEAFSTAVAPGESLPVRIRVSRFKKKVPKSYRIKDSQRVSVSWVLVRTLAFRGAAKNGGGKRGYTRREEIATGAVDDVPVVLLSASSQPVAGVTTLIAIPPNVSPTIAGTTELFTVKYSIKFHVSDGIGGVFGGQELEAIADTLIVTRSAKPVTPRHDVVCPECLAILEYPEGAAKVQCFKCSSKFGVSPSRIVGTLISSGSAVASNDAEDAGEGVDADVSAGDAGARGSAGPAGVVGAITGGAVDHRGDSGRRGEKDVELAPVEERDENGATEVVDGFHVAEVIRKLGFEEVEGMSDYEELSGSGAYLYCIAFSVIPGEEQEISSEDKKVIAAQCNILRSLRDLGLTIRPLLGPSRRLIFVCIRGDDAIYDEWAERMGMLNQRKPIKLPSPEDCGVTDEAVISSWERATKQTRLRVSLEDRVALTDISHLYEPYQRKLASDFVHDGEHKVQSRSRQEIILHMIGARKNAGGADLNLTNLQQEGIVHDAFPLHDAKNLDEIADDWLSKWRIEAPLDKLRNYFGEKIAFYFVFLGFYTRMLIIPALVGSAVAAVSYFTEGTMNTVYGIGYAIFLMLWTTVFLELWKRRRSELAHIWGVSDFTQRERKRPQFKGVPGWDPYAERPTEVFPERWKRVLFVQPPVITFISASLAVVVALMIFRESIASATHTAVIGVINATTIVILSMLYKKLVYVLVDYENHETNTAYENSLVSKSFLFQFINNYSALFFIAFSQSIPDEEKDNEDYVMDFLSTQLLTILGIKQIVSNFMEAGMPWVKRHVKRLLLRRSAEDLLTEEAKRLGMPVDEYVEKKDRLSQIQCIVEYEMTDFNTFQEYLELVIQYGFITLFASAFPPAALFSLLNNILEVRLDGVKAIRESRRPPPHRAGGIGVWADILSIISYMAVLTNVFIAGTATTKFDDVITWAADLFGERPDRDPQFVTKLWVLVAVEHFALVLKLLLAYAIPDDKRWVREERRGMLRWTENQLAKERLE